MFENVWDRARDYGQACCLECAPGAEDMIVAGQKHLLSRPACKHLSGENGVLARAFGSRLKEDFVVGDPVRLKKTSHHDCSRLIGAGLRSAAHHEGMEVARAPRAYGVNAAPVRRQSDYVWRFLFCREDDEDVAVRFGPVIGQPGGVPLCYEA